jgi:hypothetical protein
MAKFGQYLYRVIVSGNRLHVNFYKGGAYEVKDFSYSKASFDLLVWEKGVTLQTGGIYFEFPKAEIPYLAEAARDVDNNTLIVNINLKIPFSTYVINCSYKGPDSFVPYKPEIIATLIL